MCSSPSSSTESHGHNDNVPCETVRFLAKDGEGHCTLLSCKGRLIVRKTIINPSQKYYDVGDDVPREVRILRDILTKHDRIVNFLYHIEPPGALDLYYEYYPAGDLLDFIQKYASIRKEVPEAFIWHVYLQCLEALAFLQ